MQALIHGAHVCDMLETSDSSSATPKLYFDIGALMAASERLMRHSAETP
jgi:hypothetical protein